MNPPTHPPTPSVHPRLHPISPLACLHPSQYAIPRYHAPTPQKIGCANGFLGQ
ncbi:hypothetical protein PMIN07_001551 [Paraphaeosphaeria minitans]